MLEDFFLVTSRVNEPDAASTSKTINDPCGNSYCALIKLMMKIKWKRNNLTSIKLTDLTLCSLPESKQLVFYYIMTTRAHVHARTHCFQHCAQLLTLGRLLAHCNREELHLF